MSEEIRPAHAEKDKQTGGLLYKGYNGNVVLTERGVIIRRGAKGFLLQGAVRGEKEIPYESIVAVQLKKAGLTAGYLQLSLRGGSEAKRGLNEALKDENTITFQAGKNSRFLELRDIINARVDRSRQPAAAALQPVDPVTGIAQLAALRDSGALTEEEFQAAKQRLLNQL